MKMIDIRPMEEKDLTEVSEIHSQLLRNEQTQGANYGIEKMFSSFIASNQKTCLVAVSEGNVKGFILGRIKEWSFGVERSGWIELIEVDPNHMGKGIGKALAGELINYFKSENISEIFTSVKWDVGDIIAFFKSIGFDKSQFINLKLEVE